MRAVRNETHSCIAASPRSSSRSGARPLPYFPWSFTCGVTVLPSMPRAGLLGTPTLEAVRELRHCQSARAACPDLAHGGAVVEDLPMWNHTFPHLSAAITPSGTALFGDAADAAVAADTSKGLILMCAYRQGLAEFGASGRMFALSAEQPLLRESCQLFVSNGPNETVGNMMRWLRLLRDPPKLRMALLTRLNLGCASPTALCVLFRFCVTTYCGSVALCTQNLCSDSPVRLLP